MLLIQELLEGLFEQSVWIQFLVFLVYGVLVAGLAFGFLLLCRRLQPKPAEWAPVAPFSTSLTWGNINRAEHAHTSAAVAIKRLDEALSPTQLNLPELRDRLYLFVGYVSKDEWRKSRNRVVSARANATLRELHAMALVEAEKLPSATANHLLSQVDQIAAARSDKLWLGANHTETPSWVIVFALGLLAHFGIAAVHFERPKAGLVAPTLFAATSTVAYTSLGMIDDPYRYLDSLDPAKQLAD